jgi:hypothetical protein
MLLERNEIYRGENILEEYANATKCSFRGENVGG